MEALGLNLTSIIAQIINFAILFLVLKKLVFDHILKMITHEEEKIKETEEKSQKVAQELASLEKTKETTLNQTKKEASAILEQTKQEASEEKKDLIKKTKEEAATILKEAQLEIKHQEKEMKEKLKESTSDLAVKIAAKLIGQSLGKKEHRLLVKKSLLSFKKAEF